MAQSLSALFSSPSVLDARVLKMLCLISAVLCISLSSGAPAPVDVASHLRQARHAGSREESSKGTISCNISSDGVVRVREGEDFFHISCSLSGFQGNIKVVATEGTVVADQSDLRPSTETRQLLVQYASQAESLQGRCLNVISDGLTTGFCFDVAIIAKCKSISRAVDGERGLRAISSLAESQYAGDSVLLSCSHDHYMLGSSELRCEESGQWSESLPRCMPKTWNGIRLNNTLIPSSGKPYVIQAAQTAQPTFVQCAAAGVPNSELVVKLFVNSVLTYNTRKPCGTGPVCRAEAASTVMLKAGDTLECKATRTVSMGQNGEKAKEESHLVVQVEGK
eukprot:scpid69167/ scgid2182/ 